jgi:hypothetical protein
LFCFSDIRGEEETAGQWSNQPISAEYSDISQKFNLDATDNFVTLDFLQNPTLASKRDILIGKMKSEYQELYVSKLVCAPVSKVLLTAALF